MWLLLGVVGNCPTCFDSSYVHTEGAGACGAARVKAMSIVDEENVEHPNEFVESEFMKVAPVNLASSIRYKLRARSESWAFIIGANLVRPNHSL